MPKLKTHRGARKRFKVTANGKVKGNKACSRHILTKKSKKRKRNYRKNVFLAGNEAKNIKTIIGE